jgi:hypothetical protein
MSILFSSLNVPLPAGVDPNEVGYHLYTWASIGVISQSALNALCGEAWIRVPTTVGITPTPTPTPTPPPDPPVPVPVPVNPIDWATIIKIILDLLKSLETK